MLKSIAFYNEAIHGPNFTLGKPVSYLHGNVGDRCKMVTEFESLLQTVSDTNSPFEYDTISILSAQVIRSGGSFLDDGFFPGQSIELLEIGGLAQRQLGTITFVDDDHIVFDKTSGTFADGNYPDGVSTGTLQLTTISNLAGLVYRFNFIENNEATNYESKYNARSNEWKGIGLIPGTVSNLTPKNGCNVDGSISVKYVSNNSGTHTLVVTHIFTLQPFFLDEFTYNLDTDTVPSLLIGQNSLKYVFRGEMRFDNNNPNTVLVEEFDQYKGSVGWLDEELDSNPPDFAITSVTYEDQVTGESYDAIKPDKQTVVVIEATGDFLSTTTAVAKIATAFGADRYQNSNDNFADTFLYDSLLVTGGNIATGTGIIKRIRVIINSPTSATITVNIEYSTSLRALVQNQKYLMAISFADTAKALTATNKCTMLVAWEEYDATSDVPDLLTWLSGGVYAHNDTTNIKTSYRGWPRDGVRLKATAEIELGSLITGMRARVVAFNNSTGDMFTINEYSMPLGSPPVTIGGAQHFNIDSNRGFFLASDDPFNEVSLNTTNTSPYRVEVIMGLKLGWQSWIANPDVNQAFIDTTKPNNNLNQLASNYEAHGYKLYLAMVAEITNSSGVPTEYAQMIELDVYADNLDENATPEFAAAILIKDTSNNTTGVIDYNGYNNIQATMTPVGGSTAPYSNVVMYIDLEKENQPGESIHELSSLRATYAGNPLVGNAGQTLLVVTDSGTAFVATCRLDGRLLENGVNYILRARLFHKYGSVLVPIFEITTVTYTGTVGNYDLAVVATDAGAVALPAGKPVIIRAEIDAVAVEQMTGNTGDDISAFKTNHLVPANSITQFAQDPVTNGAVFKFNKLLWALQNNKYNATAKAISLYSKVNHLGQSSVEDTAVVPVRATIGKGFPYDLEHITNTKFAFADFLTGIRVMTDNLYTEFVGSLNGASSVSVDRADPTNPIIYSPNAIGEMRYWNNSNRADLGQSGTSLRAFSETFDILAVKVNNDQTNFLGMADVWALGTNGCMVRWRNGITWARLNLQLKIAALFPTYEAQSVAIDSNGDAYVLLNIPGSGSAIVKLAWSGSGSYYSASNWTATTIIGNNTVGTTDGGTAVAKFSGACKKLVIIGYNDVVGATSGLVPNFLIADYGNDVYRYLHKVGVNWTIVTDPYFCGTVGTNVYTFGAAGTSIQVGKVRGFDWLPGVGGGTGELIGSGEGTPDQVMFQVSDLATASTQLGGLIFSGAGGGSAEQIAF